MIKKIFVLFVLLLFVNIVYAADDCAQNEDLVQERLNARYAFYEYRVNVKITSMEAVISYLENENADVSELTSIKEDLGATIGTAKDAEDKQSMDDTSKEGKDLVKDFKDKANEIVDKNGLNITTIRQAVADALKESTDLDTLKSQAVEAARNQASNFLKNRVCVHGNVQEKIKNAGGDVKELESNLSEIENEIDDLDDIETEAYKACGNKALVACNAGKTALEKRQEINQMLMQLRNQTRIVGQELAVSNVKEALKNKIDRMKKLSDDDSKLDEIKNDVDEATTIKELRDTRTELNALQPKIAQQNRQKGSETEDGGDENE